MPRSIISKPTSFRLTPLAFCSRSAAAPMKSSFFQPTIHPRSASSTVVVSSMSLPCSRVAGRLDLLGNPVVVLRDVASVDDEQEVRGRETIDQQVVDERAARRQQT